MTPRPIEPNQREKPVPYIFNLESKIDAVEERLQDLQKVIESAVQNFMETEQTAMQLLWEAEQELKAQGIMDDDKQRRRRRRGTHTKRQTQDVRCNECHQ